jgi:hypothetical protein
LKNLKLPAPIEVNLYSVKGIIQSRGKLSTIGKINLLLTLEWGLIDKLPERKRVIKSSYKKAMKLDTSSE